MISPSSLAYLRLMALTSLPGSSNALTGPRPLESWMGTRICEVQRSYSLPGGPAPCPTDWERSSTACVTFFGDWYPPRPNSSRSTFFSSSKRVPPCFLEVGFSDEPPTIRFGFIRTPTVRLDFEKSPSVPPGLARTPMFFVTESTCRVVGGK